MDVLSTQLHLDMLTAWPDAKAMPSTFCRPYRSNPTKATFPPSIKA